MIQTIKTSAQIMLAARAAIRRHGLEYHARRKIARYGAALVRLGNSLESAASAMDDMAWCMAQYGRRF